MGGSKSFGGCRRLQLPLQVEYDSAHYPVGGPPNFRECHHWTPHCLTVLVFFLATGRAVLAADAPPTHGQRWPRLVNAGEDSSSPRWIPLDSSAWLSANSPQVYAAAFEEAAGAAGNDPTAYVTESFLLVDGIEALVNLAPAEALVKARIGNMASRHYGKAKCLALGLERLELQHFQEGWPNPPVFPSDWATTKKYPASGLRFFVQSQILASEVEVGVLLLLR
ncbi:unnamed protein product [Rangifer tarandus platyrhynchus]|uniref:Uncharacterized protein n=1 Tax=Rangifer tarandus platyrhynchus TaxID=3082113 RepID=A0ABN8XK76_RANTA|nr:unnamed protein product [Rangifer tarandus platyrhynchus]